MSTLVEPEAVVASPEGSQATEARRLHLFGVEIDAVTMPQAVEKVLELITVRTDSSGSPGCRYVVTPNVDHVVMLQHHEQLRDCYGRASLVLADGWPIVSASRLLGRPLPERVAGSDLVPALFESTRSGSELTAFLLGAAAGVGELAAERIEQRWPAVKVVGTYSPPLGFEHDAAENGKILGKIAAVSPQVLVVGLGAPKQELWVHEHHEQIEAGVALCVGATIDFLAGHRQRAPVWMQRTGLEWLHRLASEPGRLASRYGRDAVVFPQLVARQWRAQRG